MWKNVWVWVREPLKGFGKMLACSAVQAGGDHLQEELRKQRLTVKAFNSAFDKAQGTIKRLLERSSWIPAPMREKAKLIATEEGDRFQLTATAHISRGQEHMVDVAFDLWQQKLIERIQAL